MLARACQLEHLTGDEGHLMSVHPLSSSCAIMRVLKSKHDCLIDGRGDLVP
jgi:hypothetical protein